RPVAVPAKEPVHGREIELELAHVLRPKGLGLEFDHNVAVKLRVVEEQINAELIASYLEAVLAAHEGEAAAELEQETPKVLKERLVELELRDVVREALAERSKAASQERLKPGQ